jgi:hypothetical protein
MSRSLVAPGYTLFNAGRWEEALRAFEEVLKIAREKVQIMSRPAVGLLSD